MSAEFLCCRLCWSWTSWLILVGFWFVLCSVKRGRNAWSYLFHWLLASHSNESFISCPLKWNTCKYIIQQCLVVQLHFRMNFELIFLLIINALKSLNAFLTWLSVAPLISITTPRRTGTNGQSLLVCISRPTNCATSPLHTKSFLAGCFYLNVLDFK